MSDGVSFLHLAQGTISWRPRTAEGYDDNN